MSGTRAASRRQLRGHSARAQFGLESLVHRRVSPSSTPSFRPDPTRISELVRLARASLPERPPRLNGGFPTNVVNTPLATFLVYLLRERPKPAASRRVS